MKTPWLWILYFLASVFIASAAELKPLPKMPLKAWLPKVEEGSTKKFPLIIFSHGLGGSPSSYEYLGEGLAQAGYVVLAPEHKDALLGKDLTEAKLQDAGIIKSRLKNWRKLKKKINEDLESSPALGKPQEWNDQSQINRREDMEYVLYYASVTEPYRTLCDFERVGVAGHSLGGYTALGLCGAWESWYDPRFKAVAALSPYAQPYILKGTLKNLAAPVLYMGGTRDVGVTPYIKKNAGAYEQSPPPKFFVNIEGAQHFTFSVRGADSGKQKLIMAYLTAFFDRYLKGAPGELLDAPKPKGVAEYLRESAPRPMP